MSRPRLTLPFPKEFILFIPSSKAKNGLYWPLKYSFPCLFLCLFSRPTRNEKWSLKIKWITRHLSMKKMVHQDNDYDNYTSDTGRVDETSFTEPATIEATSTLRLRQKLKRDKISSLYRYLGVTGDPGIADLERLMIKKNSKTGNIELLFLDGNKHWQCLYNKRTGEFLAPKTLKEKFGGLNITKSALSLDQTSSALERSITVMLRLNAPLLLNAPLE